MAMDLFSGQSKAYAEFRPSYPEALYTFLLEHTKGRTRAWDCGTGNGQVAIDLTRYFERVDATDISQEQLDNAFQHPHIFYQLCQAEKTPFGDHSFDLITVGQAVHWFDFDPFFNEVKRVARPGSTFALWCYNLCSINPIIDKVLVHYYTEIVGPYWHPRRKHVDSGYQSIPFPFEEIDAPRFEIKATWSLDHFIGYLMSWSATQSYIKKVGANPVEKIQQTLIENWGTEMKTLHFPVFMRIGFVK